MNNWKEKMLAIFLILFSLILDGFIANFWSVNLETSIGLMIPRTIFLIFIILSFHYEKRFMLSNVLVFGFLMDAYYLGFIGIYLFSLLILVLIIFKFKEFVHANLLSYTMLTIVILTVVELFIFGVIRILGVSGMTLQEFLVNKLAATLLLNTLLMFSSSYFIQKLILSVREKN